MNERIFEKTDLSQIAEIRGPGLLAVAEHIQSGYSIVGHLPNGLPVWWQEALSENISEAGFTLRAVAGVVAISVIDERADSNRARLTLAFAEHLSRLRQNDPIISHPPLVAAALPVSPSECIRVPHFVAYKSSDSIRDLVIWEVMTTSEAEDWLGRTLPNQTLAESYLPHLLNLRKSIREKGLEVIINSPILVQELSSGRYVSALFFYQHFDEFQILFKEEPNLL